MGGEEKKPWAVAQALPCIGPNQDARRARNHVAGVENAGEAQGAKPGGLASALVLAKLPGPRAAQLLSGGSKAWRAPAQPGGGTLRDGLRGRPT